MKGECHAADQPTAANGTEDDVDRRIACGELVDSFDADTALAGDDLGIVERMEKGQPFIRGDLLRALQGDFLPRPAAMLRLNHACSISAGGIALGLRRIDGHDDGDWHAERLACLRAADRIVLEEIRRAGLYDQIWQAFAVLPDIRSVGVMGDERTYARPVIIRAVTSEDAMTADWARLPHDLLEKMSSRIINEVEGVNRVAYDITSKPPGTIEWE